MKRISFLAKKIFVMIFAMVVIGVVALHFLSTTNEGTGDGEGRLMKKAVDTEGNDKVGAEAEETELDVEDNPAPDYVGFCDVGILVGNGERQREVKLYLNGRYAYVFLPSYADVTGLSLRLGDNILSMSLNGTSCIDGQALNGIEIDRIYDLALEVAQPEQEDVLLFDETPVRSFDMYQLTFMQSENLPALYIDTGNKTMDYLNEDKSHWEPGDMVCFTEDGNIDSEGEIQKIHGRGNSSWADKQKGYTFIMNDDTDILSMGSARKWKLVVSGYDNTRLHQIIPLSFAQDIELPYAVDYRFGDVYFNGQYNGNYAICEAIEVADNRAELGGEDYLLEYGYGYESGHGFNQDNSHPWEILYPEHPTKEEILFIREKINYLFEKMKTCTTQEEYDDLKQYIDVESFAKLYLVNMVADDADTNIISMFYYYSAEDDKLHACAAWDFNWGLSGYYQYNSYGDGPAEWLMRVPEYANEVQAVYHQYIGAFDNVRENLIHFADDYKKSNEMSLVLFDYNEKRYDMADEKYADNVSQMLLWVDNRLNLIKETVLEPDAYCRVWIRSDYEIWNWNEWNCNMRHIFWVKKGEKMPAEFIDSFMVGGWSGFYYENGAVFDVEEPIHRDMVLTLNHHEANEAQEEQAPTADSFAGEQTEEAVAPAEDGNGDFIMTLLGIILLFTPGIISLLTSGMLKGLSRRRIPELVIYYLVFEFLTVLISYGIITLVKGSVTISFAGVNRGENYNIFYSNVVFYVSVLFLIVSGMLGIIKKICHRSLRNLCDE